MILQFPNGKFTKKVPRGQIAISGVRSKVYHTFLDCPKLSGLPSPNYILLDAQEARELGYTQIKCKECEKHE